MTSPSTSPQADILDQLIWSRLSSFWQREYDPAQRDALNAIYEAVLAVFDAEYVRLAEIRTSKSLQNCPINSQRRWLRLDLNRYADLDAFLKFIQSDSVTGSANASSITDKNSDTLNCIPLHKNHPRHWHIQFPYVVPAGDIVTRSTIDLSYPTELALVTIHRMTLNTATGRKEGLRLKPGVDYTILDNETSIRLAIASPGDEFEFNVAMNFSESKYDGLKVDVVYASGIDRLSGNVVAVPIGISQANLPIHAMVVRNVVDNGTHALADTNRSDFKTTYEFYPYTGTTSGPLHGAVAGTVALPPTITPIASSDAVFVFGLLAGDWDLAHRHDIATTVLNPAAAPHIGGSLQAAGVTDTISFDKLIQPSVFGSLGYLGQTFEVYLDGVLLSTSDFRFTGNQLILKTPVIWNSNEYVTIDIRFSIEYNTIQQILGDQHLHYACDITVAQTAQVFGSFDDGGIYDDKDTDAFDDALSINVVYLSDVLADPNTLEVFVNGVYANRDIDYTATLDSTTGRVLLSFTAAIAGKSIIATYRRDTRTFIYGAFDTSAFGNGVIGGSRATLSGLLTDVQGLISSFGKTYNFDAQNVSSLVEAASIAAAGGNPLLTLFFDEYEEYVDLPIDAANQPISSQTARTLESYNTELTSIPFLTDHVLHPNVRLQEGVDYDIKQGAILSSVDLLAPRGPDDTEPGVWWCPVVLFDENFLSKNFGALVGDVRSSSVEYQRQLTANFGLRYSGPIFRNLQWALSVLLGSPSFTQDGTVLSITDETVGYRVTVGNDSTQQVAFVPASVTPLSAGFTVVPTQSLSQAPVFNGSVRGTTVIGNVLSLPISVPVEAGDLITFHLRNPNDLPNVFITFTSRVVSAAVDLSGLIPLTTIVLKDTPRYPSSNNTPLLILRQGNPPYATIAGTILSVTPVTQIIVKTTSETFTLPEGATPEQRVGDHIFRGMPLFPSYAQLYDDTTRPNWHRTTPAQIYENYAYKARHLGVNVGFTPIADSRTASVIPPTTPTGYSLMTLTPTDPVPARGAKITFTDAVTQDVFQFTVVGSYGAGVYVTPAISQNLSGQVSIAVTPTSSPVQFFEAPNPKANAPITTSLTFPQNVRATSLQVLSTALFPPAGKVSVRLPNGGATEFTYTSLSDGFFLGCTWPTDFPALTGHSFVPGVPGPLNPLLPLTATLRLVSAFSTSRLNPAFVALVNERVVENLATGAPIIQVTDENADDLYALMKTGSTVFESRVVSRPDIIASVLEDLTPTSSSIITLSKHVIIDVYAGGANEN